MPEMSIEPVTGVVHLPALIDCHVHFREPGLTHKGDMQSEGTAAQAGGVSVVCEMPNTAPPTQSIEALHDKVRRAKETCPVRMFFFFGATAMQHLQELEELWTQPHHAALKAHCCGLKLYLDNSTGNLKSSDAVTRAAFELCGKQDIPLVAHCEHAGVNDAAAEAVPYTGPATHSARRPPESEGTSIREAIALAIQFRTPLHIAHLSTKEGLEAVEGARRDDPTLRLTCEVTPHHLFFTTEDYGCCGAHVKVNPPIRPPQHAEHLWRGLLAGSIDCIATDHAPHTLAEKEVAGDQPPSGMPGVEVVVPLLLSVASGHWPHPSAPIPAALQQANGFPLELLERTMHTNPNKIFRLGVPSSRDESVGLDLGAEWKVSGKALHSKCGWSPYEGWTLKGRVILRQ